MFSPDHLSQTPPHTEDSAKSICRSEPASQESQLTLTKLDEKQRAQHNSTSVQSLVNLMKIALGIAAICYPFTIQYVGAISSVLWLSLIAMIS